MHCLIRAAQTVVLTGYEFSLVYHLFMRFADGLLCFSGFVDVFGREPTYRRVILVIRASSRELLRRIFVAFENVGFSSWVVGSSSAVRVIRLPSLRHALAAGLLTGKPVLLIHVCAEVCRALLLACEFLQSSEIRRSRRLLRGLHTFNTTVKWHHCDLN